MSVYAFSSSENFSRHDFPNAKVQQLKTTLTMYSGLTLNQYGVASPCRTICTVCGFVALS